MYTHIFWQEFQSCDLVAPIVCWLRSVPYFDRLLIRTSFLWVPMFFCLSCVASSILITFITFRICFVFIPKNEHSQVVMWVLICTKMSGNSLNWVKSSQVVTCVKYLHKTDITWSVLVLIRDLSGISILWKPSRYMGCLVGEAIEIRLCSSNYSRDKAFSLSHVTPSNQSTQMV